MQIGIGGPRPFKLRQGTDAVPLLPQPPPQLVVQDSFLAPPGQPFDEHGADAFPLTRLSVKRGEIGPDPRVFGRGIECLLHQRPRLFGLPQPRLYAR